MIEKHLIHMQRSKKSRKHYKWADESGPGSWVSCLLLMLSFSHPGVSVVSPVFERCFKVILRSAVLPTGQSSAGALCEWKLIQELIPFSFTVYELVKST